MLRKKYQKNNGAVCTSFSTDTPIVGRELFPDKTHFLQITSQDSLSFTPSIILKIDIGILQSAYPIFFSC